METNLIAQSMVIEIERARLPKLAERGRLVEEAVSARKSNPARWMWRERLAQVLHPGGHHGQRALQTAHSDAH